MSDVNEQIEKYQGDEMLDVLNENGIPTGKISSRKEVHQNGYWHRAIIVAIVNEDNKILIQKRSSKKEKFPGLWDLSVAGHVPFSQDSVSCAASEIMEEVGYMLKKTVNVKDFRFMTSFRNQISLSDTFIENQFYDFFVYNANINLEDLEIQKDEVEEVRYATVFEIKTMIEKGLFHPRNEWLSVIYSFITKF